MLAFKEAGFIVHIITRGAAAFKQTLSNEAVLECLSAIICDLIRLLKVAKVGQQIRKARPLSKTRHGSVRFLAHTIACLQGCKAAVC